jgi:hypothetical protein
MNSLFLYYPPDLEAEIPGGVQICSREYLDFVEEASDQSEPFPVPYHPSLKARALFRLLRDSYALFEPGSELESLIRTIEEKKITHLFINKSELAPYARAIKERFGDKVRTIILSHGNQSGDDLYEFTGEHGRFRRDGVGRLWNAISLGHALIRESVYRRRSIDLVVTLSHEEEVLEQWLGAGKVLYLTRAITFRSVQRRPVPGRVGFVGTLNHTPNRVALEEIFKCLQEKPIDGLDLRLVGRPEAIGVEMAQRLPFVTYLGALSEEKLEEEVATWGLFLNPIFWLSRGASMKLSRAFGWGVPVISTKAGGRGYQLDGCPMVMTENDPDHFCTCLRAWFENDPNVLSMLVGKSPQESCTIRKQQIEELREYVC